MQATGNDVGERHFRQLGHVRGSELGKPMKKNKTGLWGRTREQEKMFIK